MEMKDRLKIPRQPMPEQDPKVRARNFDEVPLGYTPEMAKTEALRCIQCKNPTCVEGCPRPLLLMQTGEGRQLAWK